MIHMRDRDLSMIVISFSTASFLNERFYQEEAELDRDTSHYLLFCQQVDDSPEDGHGTA
jgi:hypothetical protein